MKKLFLLLFMFASFGVFAQAKAPAALTNSAAAIVDAGIVTAPVTLTYDAATVTFQTLVTKVSGTVAGVVKIQGSLDGTTWFNATTDSLALQNLTTNQYKTIITNNPWYYYRVYAKGSGTMNATITSFVLPRKR